MSRSIPYPNTLQSTVDQIRTPESSANQNRVLLQIVKNSGFCDNFLEKNDDVLLVYEVLDNNVYLLLRMNNFTI